LFINDKDAWRQVVQTGMKQDWSWTQSAAKYVSLYRDTLARRRAMVTTN